MPKFSEKTVIITGGAAGIGLAAAKLYAAQGPTFLSPAADRTDSTTSHAMTEPSWGSSPMLAMLTTFIGPSISRWRGGGA